MVKNKTNIASVLVVDDDTAVLDSIAGLLMLNGIQAIKCQDSRNVMEVIATEEVSLILLDLTMPYVSGQELLSMIRLEYPEIPVVIITATSNVETAVECMKQGAYDYLVKAVEAEELLSVTFKALEMFELRQELNSLKKHILSNELENPKMFSAIITRNDNMHSIFLYMESIAKSRKEVLVYGESGTGKELFAKALHDLSGRRGEYVSVNVAGINDDLFSDTIFGHRAGAYTGSVGVRDGLIKKAEGGTLFLDEIGELSMQSQIKLLRVIENKEYFQLGSDVKKNVNTKIIVATNKKLKEEVDNGKFRKDLYFRLNTHKIQIPPLNERKDDIPLLLKHFINISADDLGKKRPVPPPELYTLLDTYSFPGNVRELKSMVYNAISCHSSGKLSMDLFKEAIGFYKDRNESCRSEVKLGFTDTLPTLKEASETLIDEALKRADGNQTIASGLLGISQQALNKRLRRKNE